MGNLIKAWEYVQSNMNGVDSRYKPTFHASSPVGWLNDPNGFSYALGEYHLFYQYNPYDTKWGPMHWGHFTTKDFVKWELKPIALAPDMPYDAEFGCFSGSAIQKDDKMYLFYTGALGGVQTQCIAQSSDGIKFTKTQNNPVIDVSQLPTTSSKTDFRDPKVFKRGEYYYAIIGGKSSSGDGQLLLYKSLNLTEWSYVGISLESPLTNPGIFECPDYAIIGDKEVLFASPQFYPTQNDKFENVHSVIYMVGALDYQTGKFENSKVEEIDSGFDFYASQALRATDGRTIMTAWMQMWDRTMPSALDGFAGAMILPRELTLKGNKLIQTPIKEIEKYRQNKVTYGSVPFKGDISFNDIKGKILELNVSLKVGDKGKTGVKLFCGNENETLVYYDKETKSVIFDRTKSGMEIKTSTSKEKDASIRHCKVELVDSTIDLRIFIDKSSVEVFINDGEETMTGNVYPNTSSEGISFFSDSEASIKGITKYDIKV